MNSTRVLVTMALLTLGLSIFALARVALPPQAVLEETISGTIAATRTITQRFRGDGIMLFNSTRSLVTHVTASTNCQSGILVYNSSDNHIESNVSVRNGTTMLPCGGL